MELSGSTVDGTHVPGATTLVIGTIRGKVVPIIQAGGTRDLADIPIRAVSGNNPFMSLMGLY